jgi:hypothetical protein
MLQPFRRADRRLRDAARKGVAVHSKNCPNVKNSLNPDRDRVSTADSPDSSTSSRDHHEDRRDLARVISTIPNLKTNIRRETCTGDEGHRRSRFPRR